MANASANVARELNSRADKQLETIYKTVGALKDLGFHKFSTQLMRQAYAYDWDPTICNMATTALTAAQIAAADDDLTADGVKKKLDRRNAFLVIMHATDGHPVESLLESMTPGNPRLAFATLHSYFHPGTTAGLQAAYVDLFSATMAISGTTILGWIAHVARAAKIVRESGGQADEGAEIAVLLKGLLPEFKGIKIILNQTSDLTLQKVVPILMDFAKDENLHELCKGGNAKGGDNVYYADTAPAQDAREQCKMWKEFRCSYGPRCFRSHVGPGGLLVDHPQNKTERQKQVRWQDKEQGQGRQKSRQHLSGSATSFTSTATTTTPSSTAAACHFCLDGSSHQPEQCPVVSSTSINFSYLVGAPEDPSIEQSERLKSALPLDADL
jgi:hypothetical protein